MKAILLSLLLLIAGGIGWIFQHPGADVVQYESATTTTSAVAASTSTTADVPATTTAAVQKPSTPASSPKTEASIASANTPAPKPAPAETKPTPTKTGDDYATEIAADAFAQTNIERIKNGLPALVYDTKLSLIARAHSADMLAANYFSHTNKSSCDSACRVKNANYGYSYVGENIFMASGFELSGGDTASLVVQGWMGSPGHRANILQKEFTNSGVGVAFEGKKIYITAIYSKPR